MWKIFLLPVVYNESDFNFCVCVDQYFIPHHQFSFFGGGWMKEVLVGISEKKSEMN